MQPFWIAYPQTEPSLLGSGKSGTSHSDLILNMDVPPNYFARFSQSLENLQETMQDPFSSDLAISEAKQRLLDIVREVSNGQDFWTGSDPTLSEIVLSKHAPSSQGLSTSNFASQKDMFLCDMTHNTFDYSTAQADSPTPAS